MKDIKLKIHFRNMRKWLGLCYYGKDYIEINPKQAQSEIVNVLIHEIIHWIIMKLLEGQFVNKKITKNVEVLKIKKLTQSTTKKIEKLEEKLCDDIAEYAGKKIHEFMMRHVV